MFKCLYWRSQPFTTFYSTSSVMLLTVFPSAPGLVLSSTALRAWGNDSKAVKYMQGRIQAFKGSAGTSIFFILLSHNNPTIVTSIKGSPRNVKTCFSAALLWQTKIAGTSVPHKQASVTWNMGFLLREGRWHKYHSYRTELTKHCHFKCFYRNMTELLNWNRYLVETCQTWKVGATKTQCLR